MVSVGDDRGEEQKKPRLYTGCQGENELERAFIQTRGEFILVFNPCGEHVCVCI